MGNATVMNTMILYLDVRLGERSHHNIVPRRNSIAAVK